MSQIKINKEKINQILEDSLEKFVVDFSGMCYDVIDTERFWQNWYPKTTPYRDIVDTTDLRNSMERSKLEKFRWRIRWSTFYVTLVYFGYVLPNGGIIPPRKWVEIAIEENDLRSRFIYWLRLMILYS